MPRLKIVSLAMLLIASMSHPLAAAQTAPAKKTGSFKALPTETAIHIKSMHCKSCAKKIAGKLYAVRGVMRVRTDVKQNLVVITPQPKKKIDAQALWKAVHAAGYQPLKLAGPSGTYLPKKDAKTARRVTSSPRPTNQQR